MDPTDNKQWARNPSTGFIEPVRPKKTSRKKLEKRKPVTRERSEKDDTFSYSMIASWCAKQHSEMVEVGSLPAQIRQYIEKLPELAPDPNSDDAVLQQILGDVRFKQIARSTLQALESWRTDVDHEARFRAVTRLVSAAFACPADAGYLKSLQDHKSIRSAAIYLYKALRKPDLGDLMNQLAPFLGHMAEDSVHMRMLRLMCTYLSLDLTRMQGVPKGNDRVVQDHVQHIDDADFVVGTLLRYLASQQPAWQTPARWACVRFAETEAEFLKRLTRYARRANADEQAAIDRCLGLELDAAQPVTQQDALLFMHIVRGVLQTAADHSVNPGGGAIYALAKSRNLSAADQRRLANAAKDFKLCTNADESALVDATLVHLDERVRNKSRTTTKRGLSWPVAARWLPAFARGAVAQCAGRATNAGLLGLLAYPALMGKVAGESFIAVFLVFGLMTLLVLLGSIQWLYTNGHPLSRPRWPRAAGNQRNITLAIAGITAAAALGNVALAIGHIASEPEQQANDPFNQGIRTDVVTYHGIGGYLLFQSVGLQVARLVRQVLQTMTQTNYSAGLGITYRDGSPLTDDDREQANMVRDLFYAGTSLLFLAPPLHVSLTGPLSLTWLNVLMTSFNEAADEVNPDLALLLVVAVRNLHPRYAGSHARFAVTDSPSPNFLEPGGSEFFDHWGPQAVARLLMFGLSDTLSTLADILKIHNIPPAYWAVKYISIILSSLLGGARGRTMNYMRGGGAVPSGFLTRILRPLFGRDAKNRIQVRPVVLGEVSACGVVRNRLTDLKHDWDWVACKRIAMDDKLVAFAYPAKPTLTFHQAEPTCLNIALVNMLQMQAIGNEHDLLIARGPTDMPLDEAVRHANERKKNAKDHIRQRINMDAFQADLAFFTFKTGQRKRTARQANNTLTAYHISICASYSESAEGDAQDDASAEDRQAYFLYRHGRIVTVLSPKSDEVLDHMESSGAILTDLELFLAQRRVRDGTTITCAYVDRRLKVDEEELARVAAEVEASGGSQTMEEIPMPRIERRRPRRRASDLLIESDSTESFSSVDSGTDGSGDTSGADATSRPAQNFTEPDLAEVRSRTRPMRPAHFYVEKHDPVQGGLAVANMLAMHDSGNNLVSLMPSTMTNTSLGYMLAHTPKFDGRGKSHTRKEHGATRCNYDFDVFKSYAKWQPEKRRPQFATVFVHKTRKGTWRSAQPAPYLDALDAVAIAYTNDPNARGHDGARRYVFIAPWQGRHVLLCDRPVEAQ